MNTYGGRFDSSVEIAHVYAPDHLTEHVGWRSEDGVELPTFAPPSASQLRWREIAMSYSRKPIILSLIDDVEVTDETAAVLTDMSVIEALEPADVYRESEYLGPAKELVHKLRNSALPDDFRLSKDQAKLITGSGKNKQRISITGFGTIDDPEHPSCQMLDLAWTLDRLQSVSPNGGNILPIAYKTQQQQVAKIASILPEFQGYKFTSIFVDDEGYVDSKMVWDLASGA